MKIHDEQFISGQRSYSRGVGLRTIVEQSAVLLDEAKEDEAESLVLGYLDGVVSSIRRIDNLMMFPAGPDK